MSLYADIVLPLPLDQTFTYSIPPELEGKIKPGMRVLVPFGEKTQTGFVIRIGRRKKKLEIKLKSILDALDSVPIFSSPFLAFTEKLGRNFYTPWGEVLQASVPPSFILRSKVLLGLTQKGREALEKGELSEEEKAVAALLQKKAHRPRYLERSLGLRNLSTLLSRMEKKELILLQEKIRRVRRKRSAEAAARPQQLELDFSVEENLARVADTISRTMAKKVFSPFLLCGPPQKREAVYFHLIKEALSVSGRVLYFVPEISLTPVLLDKLVKRLGDKVAVLHSQLTEYQREKEWRKIQERQAKVVVGPRSALFSPLEGLRLIILDEEHDESYSPQEGFSYDVRLGAWLRAKVERTILILGSAMPTIEAYYRAQKGRYLVDLGAESRSGKTTLADSRKEESPVCRLLKQKVKERLARKQPVLIFVNRRGYAAYLLCARCRFVPKCRRCDLALSYHKKEGKLICHHCRSSLPKSESCPRCGGRLLERRGAGVEAVAEELKRAFPQSRVEIFTADEVAGKRKMASLLDDFKKGEVDILVGTRFLAHQVGLPPVFLVGVIHPEMILNLADFRSGQKAFQAIARAKAFLRDDPGAEAVIQTAAPDHFIIREASLGNYGIFYETEIKFRRLMNYPPFSSVAEVIFQGRNLRRVAEKSREFATRVKNSGKEVEIFGPSLASLPRLKELNRIQVNLKARRKDVLNRVLLDALKGINLKKSVLVFG